MKKLWKITGIVCLAIMNMFHFSCGKNSGNEKPDTDIFPYRTAKTNVKTDGQLYTGGVLDLPSYLWSERKTKTYGELDKGTAKGIFVETLENEYAFAYVALPANADRKSACRERV